MEQWVENIPFDMLKLGARAETSASFTPEARSLLAATGGKEYCLNREEQLGALEPGSHSAYLVALWCELLGRVLPGPGTELVALRVRFCAPWAVGESVRAEIRVTHKDEATRRVFFACQAFGPSSTLLAEGEAEVIAPAEKIRRSLAAVPSSHRERRYQELMSLVAGLPRITMAVAHPCSEYALLGALEAAEAGIIEPILVGPRARIAAIAEKLGHSLAGIELIDTPHSHASAEVAVELCRKGACASLMKGSLHTDELMSEVVHKERGLRTARRISHVFLADVPTYPHPLLITDAAINIEPSLEEKADIVQNAIELAHALGIDKPKVAILSAVETVNPKMRSTLDAAALCKMADRGQITGGILDGPLAFDNAISLVAAKIKGIESAVAGDPDILLVPDLEAGNMLAKQLEYLAGALLAGIVLGARVPIVLTSRADTAETRVASCALAQILVAAKAAAPKTKES